MTDDRTCDSASERPLVLLCDHNSVAVIAGGWTTAHASAPRFTLTPRSGSLGLH
jgi:hypothetical protein